MERKNGNGRMPFDETDHYAQITGLELTQEQLDAAGEAQAEARSGKIVLKEMPTRELLQDFLRGAFGDTEIKVVFDLEEGKFRKSKLGGDE